MAGRGWPALGGGCGCGLAGLAKRVAMVILACCVAVLAMAVAWLVLQMRRLRGCLVVSIEQQIEVVRHVDRMQRAKR